MDDIEQIVFLVDDDPYLRESVVDLLASAGITALSMGTVDEYLQLRRPDLPGCILLDIDLPGVSGLEFQEKMESDDHPPVVFITGHADVPSSVRAMKRGAVDFLIKPFDQADLLAAIHAAVQLDRIRRADREQITALRARLSDLTPREREVFPLIVSGLLNKQAAAQLGISEVTFQIHRGKVMQKMQASSLADLVRIASKLEIPINHSRHSGAA